jgi:hypothetical protein
MGGGPVPDNQGENPALPVKIMPAHRGGGKEFGMVNKYFCDCIDEKAFELVWRQFDENRKDCVRVYHCTKKDFFCKIMSERSLVFGKIGNVQGDKFEIAFGLKVLQAILEKGNEKYAKILELIKQKPEDQIGVMQKPFFIFCTSEKLTQKQWLEYGDSGRGGGIIFNRKGLFNTLTRQMQNCNIQNKALWYVYPVVYYNEDYTLCKSRIKQFEPIILMYLSLLEQQLQEPHDQSFADEVFRIILAFSSLIKNSKYQEENEWRYLVLKDNDECNIHISKEDDTYIAECIEGLEFGPYLKLPKTEMQLGSQQ